MPRARKHDTIDVSAKQIDIVKAEPSTTIPVRLLKTLTVRVIGGVTGNTYIFNGAGSVVNVDILDLESIRKKNQTHISCCGGKSSPYFEIL